MCTSPMWRIPVSPACANFVFKNDMRGYRNGAFIVSHKDPGRLQHIMGTLEKLSLRQFKKASDGVVTIPCGQCLECKIDNSKEWAQRSVAESMCHSENWFITLTYDDEHLPPPILSFSRHSLDFGYWSPLVYRDFELFKKRLLERFRELGHTGIRFFACGEYGPNNGRPHFHAIFYNLPIPDLEKCFSNSLGGRKVTYLSSKLIEDTWGNGFVTIGECNFDTSAYVARYVTKKMTNLEEHLYKRMCEDYNCDVLPPEFRQASRRPGLGRPYFDENFEKIYENDCVFLPNGKTPKPCAYYDNLYKIHHEPHLHELKLQRKAVAELQQKNELINIRDINNYNKNKHDFLARKLTKLKRPL